MQTRQYLRAHRATPGFSLVEMAVVLAIVGILLSSVMFTLSAQIDQRNRSETQRRLEEARELLIGFAMVNGRLPCPARSVSTSTPATSAGDEVRDSTDGQCTGDSVTDNYGGTIASSVTGGLLPAKAIGFQQVDTEGFAVDAWGNRIRYAVSATNWSTGAGRFTRQHVSGAAAAWSITQTPADLVVCSAASSGSSCNSGESVTNTSTVVALIFSTGKNGSTTASGAGANEAENLGGGSANDSLFVSRPPDPSGATGGEFDDMMVWIPVGQLYGKLISAGVLP